MIENPFVLRDYVSDEYFCDREKETRDLAEELKNGNNVTLIAPRRIGKTGLIQHLFAQKEIQKQYYTFLIDIYATKNVEEMVQEIGKSILYALKPRGKRVMRYFLECVQSLRPYINFDISGNPTWGVELGNIQAPETTLDEIFHYLDTASRPCIVAIDEFQTINNYNDDRVEARLRTYVQHCSNARFIFSGSHRTMMSEMFLSYARPFYMSTSIKNLDVIDKAKYTDFACRLFAAYKKAVAPETVEGIYDRFAGITWYMQRMLNKIFSMTEKRQTADAGMIDEALQTILDESEPAYQSLLYQLPAKQKELLMAINAEGGTDSILSNAFIKKYALASASSVQAAIKGLLQKDFVTNNNGRYEVYDKFFSLWLKRLA